MVVQFYKTVYWWVYLSPLISLALLSHINWFCLCEFISVLSILFCWLGYLFFCHPIICWFSEKAMATHSSTLAWRIPGAEEPGGLPSMGSHRVGHDWSDLAARITRSMDLVSYTAFYFFVIIAPCSIINLFRLFISISF